MSSSSSLPPSNIHFPSEEETVLQLWKEWDVFQSCLRQSKAANRPRFSFYDGPPFATGLPHYGHILAGTIKDIVPRWKHQHGFHVDRRFGWDTHGLPIEHEIDKKLGIRGPQDVAKIGIRAYNDACRDIVMRYSNEWEKTVTRMGRWIDFKHDYKSMYPWFMESVWWVFSQLWEKGLIYKGTRVMPYSTGLCTPVANFEVAMNYRDVNDPAVIVNFPLDDEPDVALIAWTTTPWTLPSNLALCVHPDLDYVRVKDNATDKVYIMMEARLSALFKKEAEYTILSKFKGVTLKNKHYKPMFDYFGHLKQPGCPDKGAFRVMCDTYVTQDAGTGVVHQAPYFGEDDNRVCVAGGIITRDQDVVCPLDDVGKFVEPVKDFVGQYVKDADKNIIKMLKENGRLVHQSQVKHSYPFCWRSDTPLLYRAVPSWFMRVESMRDKLVDRLSDTYWVPESIKEGRFANWLKDARDWNLSRNRYWGTPIPVWVSEDGEESVCVGSIEQLEKLTGTKVTDLHRDHVDQLTIPSARPGQPPLRRISEVFDCWFESGSMPYAQQHYPFENKKLFEETFPADFIAEGSDQTRGWFYTLLVLSTALFNQPPYKNLIINGIVLAADGQKMSKSKKNYPDPLNVVDKYGADAVRLYLINSPVVRAETLRFKEEGVKDILKDVFLPWYNAFRFLLQNIESYESRTGRSFTWTENEQPRRDVMDIWISSFAQSMLAYVKKEMAAYRLYTVLPRLMKFIDNLTNWYVRTNRKRLKGEGNSDEDCAGALNNLFAVLFDMVRVMAPFTPFLTEMMYQRMRKYIQGSGLKEEETKSVHFLMIPEPKRSLIDEKIERAVARVQSVIELGRVVRDRKTMPLKYPLPELVVIHKDQDYLDSVRFLESLILDELNVKKLTLSTDKEQYGVRLRAEPDHKTLGARLKGAFKEATKAIRALGDDQISEFLRTQKLSLLGHDLRPDDLRIMYTFAGDQALSEKYEAHSDNDVLILLDCTPDQAMLDEGVSREVINRVQKLRKKANLMPSDDVTVYYGVAPAGHDLGRVVEAFREGIETTTKSPIRLDPKAAGRAGKIAHDTYDLKGAKLELTIVPGFCSGYVRADAPADAPAAAAPSHGEPPCKFVNVAHGDRVGVVLLENPVGENRLTYPQLVEEARAVFDLQGDVSLFEDAAGAKGVAAAVQKDVAALHGKALYVGAGAAKRQNWTSASSCCKFIRVEDGKKVATMLLENPAGSGLGLAEAKPVLQALFGGKKASLFKDKTKKAKLESWNGMNGATTAFV